MYTWSNTTPTEPGWYWRRVEGMKDTLIELTVEDGVLGFWITTSRGTSGFTVEDLVKLHLWKFAGPVPTPWEEA